MRWRIRKKTRKGRDEVVVRHEVTGHFIACFVNIECPEFPTLHECNLVANRSLLDPDVSFGYRARLERLVNTLHLFCG
jgi:hypothetical protein